jgi:hypothetical protein
MDINTIFIGLLLIPVLYGVYAYYTQPEWIAPTLPKPLWGEQVGKSKLIQSKTGDASLFTEKARRTANRTGGFQKGFMSAAIDYFFISGLCPCTKIPKPECKCACCDIVDGGDGAPYVYSEIYDGGNVYTQYSNCAIDGGTVIHGQTCSCCPNTTGGDSDDILDDVYSGGNANTIFTGTNIDGGNV